MIEGTSWVKQVKRTFFHTVGAAALQLLATMDAVGLMYQREVGWKTNLSTSFEYKKLNLDQGGSELHIARDRRGAAEAAPGLLSSDTHNERWHRALWAPGTAQPGISVPRYFTFSDSCNLNMHQE